MRSMSVNTVNPATGEIIATYPIEDRDAVEAKVAASHTAFRQWRDIPPRRRADQLVNFAEHLSNARDRLARLITTEMGKTLAEAEAEVDKCAGLARWMAENGPGILADEPAPVAEADAYVSFLPIGVVLAVMPWNFPLWQVLRAAIPITLAGNAFLLKHAPNVLGCAAALVELFEASGAPEGLLSSINVSNETVDDLIKDDRISAVTLTGSVRAGAAVASLAGAAVKKSLLELGGSDPFIVLRDADLEAAITCAVNARFQNAGQVCLAAKRFFVEASVAKAFTEGFLRKARALRFGNPLDRATQVGPMARGDLRDELHRQVEATRHEGADLLLGGEKPAGDGFFYPPTVLTGVKSGMTAFREETFGPVAAITVVADADEAVALANDSAFGLGGSLWTADPEKARSLARRLETGAVFINAMTVSDPRVPVGGIRRSGYGRELSHFGLREFVNAQTVWMARPNVGA